MAKKWISKAIEHPGALHEQLGVPEGKKIPAKKLNAAAKKGGKLSRRARLAKTLKGLHGGSTPISSTSMKGESFGNRAALLKEKAAWSCR
jgi:hypothetical protein